MSDLKELKQKRGRKLSALTRVRRRALAMLEVGSRSKLATVFQELDEVLGKLEEVNDDLIALLTTEEDKTEAALYFQNAEKQYQEVIDQIEDYLKSRKGEPPSVVSQDSTESAASKKAEITARVKKLEVTQLEKRLELERREQEIHRQRQLQEAQDAREAAELQAQLTKAAEDQLNWERRNDFEGETGLQGEGAALTQPVSATQPASSEAVHAETGLTALQGERAVLTQLVSNDLPASSGAATLTKRVPRETVPNQPVPAAQAVSSEAVLVQPQPATRPTSSPAAHDCAAQSLFHRSLPRLSLPKFDGNPGDWVVFIV